jgi:hypothetical protein
MSFSAFARTARMTINVRISNQLTADCCATRGIYGRTY